MEKEKFYYLKDSAWEELEGIASFTNTFGDFAEYYDKKECSSCCIWRFSF